MGRDLFLDDSVAENCYSFLKKPVIVTEGGNITPVFFNGEKLMQDGDNYKQFEMSPTGMFEYAERRYEESVVFKKVIDNAVDKIEQGRYDIISGGRTRDWPFAAIIAKQLNLPFLALFKDIDSEIPTLYDLSSQDILPISEVNRAQVAHVVDLVTSASSVTKKNWGWIPQIRNLNGHVNNIYAFIDRNQGARENIQALGAKLHSFCSITPDWIKKYDPEHLEVVQNYLSDPVSWTMNYLHENSIEVLGPYVNGSWDKDDRFLKFLTLNRRRLYHEGLWSKIIDYANERGYTTHNGKHKGNVVRAFRVHNGIPIMN